MRGMTLLTALVGLTITLLSGRAYGFRCPGAESFDNVADPVQMELKGAAETLFVIAGRGIDSKEFSTNVERFYAKHPSSERQALGNRLREAFCAILAGAQDVAPASKGGLLRQFTDRMNELDQQELPATREIPSSSHTAPGRIAGDWDPFYNGHDQGSTQRIAIDPAGAIKIEQLGGQDDPHTRRLTGRLSGARLDGNTLRYTITLPSGKESYVWLEIIDNDLMVGTYSWGYGTAIGYELRRRSGPEHHFLTTESGASDAVSSTASNTR